MIQYQVRWILYIINKLMIVLSLACVIYCLIKLILDLENWLEWAGFIAAGMGIYFLSKVLYVIRKSYFPLAGKDYL